ncbi:MAG: carboxylesterase family protein [Acidimicrobiales bacterium]|nr:alpha/beta hydrolase [Actinomycetota bacterium]
MRRRLLVVVFALVALLVTGCDLRLTTPTGDAPLRYRDAVFASVAKTADVVYGQAPDQQGNQVTLKLDLYEPVGDTVTARPLIVLVHGGSFKSGTKTSAELVDQANVYAKSGYVVASISYRLAPNGCTSITIECINAIRDAKHDAQAAVRFLRSKAADYDLDAGRVAMAGSSAGAITAVEVGYGSDDVGTSGTPGYDSTIRSAVSLSGAKILTSPDPGEAAVLLLHSTGDPVVPYQWATNTVDAATAAGTTVEITSWDEATHVPYAQHRTEILDQTTNFLYWTLDLTHAAR